MQRAFLNCTKVPDKFEITEAGQGFYPVTADIPKKRHTVPKECSYSDAEDIAQSSNAKPSL